MILDIFKKGILYQKKKTPRGKHIKSFTKVKNKNQNPGESPSLKMKHLKRQGENIKNKVIQLENSNKKIVF